MRKLFEVVEWLLFVITLVVGMLLGIAAYICTSLDLIGLNIVLTRVALLIITFTRTGRQVFTTKESWYKLIRDLNKLEKKYYTRL